MADGAGPWLVLAGLGAFHGINPAMGWLFAVALGLQEKRARAVWRALLPLALGHALAVGAVTAVVALIGSALPPELLRWLVAGTLVSFGGWRLVRHRHPRYGGMRVGPRELTMWSFLMATAHGAGLMVAPFLLGRGAAAAAVAPVPAGHVGHVAQVAHGVGAVGATGADAAPLLAGVASAQGVALAMALIHTAGYLLVTGLVAVTVYRKLGLRLLRTAWINLDLIWATALVLTGVGALLV